MSSVSGISGQSQVFAQIDKLNKLTAQATTDQIEFTTKLVKLAVTGNVDAQKQATTSAVLDTVI